MDKLEVLMQDRRMTLFDCIMTEIMDERNAEKEKVRNRRKAERKAKRKSGAYVKRNGGDWRKDEHYAGDGRMWHDTYNWELSKSQTGGKIRERSLRKDFEIEQDNHADAMAEYYDYIRMAEDHDRKLEELESYAWERMADDVSREWNRIKQIMNYANEIYADEEYFRKQKSFGINAGVYLRMLQRERNEWLKYA